VAFAVFGALRFVAEVAFAAGVVFVVFVAELQP